MDAVAEAAERWAEANRRLHAAQVVAGTVDTTEVRHDPRERAEAAHEVLVAHHDQACAENDFHAARSEVAQQWLEGMRLAIELYPEKVGALFADLVGDIPPPVGVTEAIAELEDRVDAAEDAVVNLEQGRVTR